MQVHKISSSSVTDSQALDSNIVNIGGSSIVYNEQNLNRRDGNIGKENRWNKEVAEVG